MEKVGRLTALLSRTNFHEHIYGGIRGKGRGGGAGEGGVDAVIIVSNMMKSSIFIIFPLLDFLSSILGLIKNIQKLRRLSYNGRDYRSYKSRDYAIIDHKPLI